MIPTDSLLILSTSALLALGVVTAAGAWSWKGWLQLRYRQLDLAGPPELPAVAARIDLADMKERIKKLEAIAAGVEL